MSGRIKQDERRDWEEKHVPPVQATRDSRSMSPEHLQCTKSVSVSDLKPSNMALWSCTL